MQSLKAKRIVEKNAKQIEALDKTEKIHLPPEQRFTFHYLSSEYLAIAKIYGFITRGGIYDPEVSGIISRYLLDKREMLTNEFNLLHGVCTGESFAILPRDIDNNKMNISIHSEVVRRVADEYRHLIVGPNYNLDEERYTKSTIQWLNHLVHYRSIMDNTYPMNNPSQILYHLIQTIGSSLADIVESAVDTWLGDETNPEIKATAINSCLYYFNNFILSTVVESTSDYLSEQAINKLTALEEEMLNENIDDIIFVLRMFIFQDYIANQTIDGKVVKNLLTSLFTCVLNINQDIISPATVH